MAGEGKSADLEQLIAEFEASDLRELHVREGDFEIYLSKDSDSPGVSSVKAAGRHPGMAQPVAPSQAEPAEPGAPRAEPEAEISAPDGAIVVRAPYLGTFYRSPKPGAPAYVDVGDTVSAETELCLVEVMKLFTSVRAGCAGKVHAILAEDGAMVAADQPLFILVAD